MRPPLRTTPSRTRRSRLCMLLPQSIHLRLLQAKTTARTTRRSRTRQRKKKQSERLPCLASSTPSSFKKATIRISFISTHPFRRLRPLLLPTLRKTCWKNTKETLNMAPQKRRLTSGPPSDPLLLVWLHTIRASDSGSYCSTIHPASYSSGNTKKAKNYLPSTRWMKGPCFGSANKKKWSQSEELSTLQLASTPTCSSSASTCLPTSEAKQQRPGRLVFG